MFGNYWLIKLSAKSDTSNTSADISYRSNQIISTENLKLPQQVFDNKGVIEIKWVVFGTINLIMRTFFSNDGKLTETPLTSWKQPFQQQFLLFCKKDWREI